MQHYDREENQYEKYSNPKIRPSAKSIISYDNLKSAIESKVKLQIAPKYDDYPDNASFSRFPVKIRCRRCNELTMTDIEYENGGASKAWCFILMPFLCTGCCCLCLNSCKDVKHFCSKCQVDAGTCKSDYC